MNEEQRAVLAAIHRMEGNPGTLIDEYTVARSADIVTTDLTGNEYLQSSARERIRHTLDELEVLGLIRLDREGYWRPRTTLSGRRSLQRPLVALPSTRPRPIPPADPELVASRQADTEVALPPPTEQAINERGRWPAWWPAALRIGDPSLTPILAPVLAILVLVLVFAVGARVLGGGTGAATPSPGANGASTTIAGGQPPPPTAQVAPTVGSNGANPGGAAGTPRPPTPTRAALTPTPGNRAPTPTAGPSVARVMVANTDNKGAFVYVLPAGERRFAIPEGFVLEVIGPDERDTKGQNWKHIRYLDFEGWIPEEYTVPAG
ncbi:MAG TPA: hypothetical protein VIL85_18980 [Thermomicrobiales bacterium]|jgi:hypothetical protein